MFRTEEGAKAICRIRSYIATARKHAGGALDALARGFSGTPLVPALDSSFYLGMGAPTESVGY